MRQNNNRNRPSSLRLGLAIALGLSLVACADTGGKRTEKSIYAQGRPIQGNAIPQGAQSIWEGGEYGYVRIVDREGRAQPNQHPVSLEERQVRALLEQIQYRQGARDEARTLFNSRQLEALEQYLPRALSQAGPDQDVMFAVAAPQDSGGALSFFSPLAMTTGRAFYQEGRLNVILGTINEPFGSELRATGMLKDFESGRRDQAADLDETIVPGQGVMLAATGRQDWLQLSAISPPVQQGYGAQPQPVYQTQPQPTYQPQPAQQAQAPAGGRYQEIEERLRTLQRVHREGLISDQDYERRRREIIDEL